jgi:hypothetical protein
MGDAPKPVEENSSGMRDKFPLLIPALQPGIVEMPEVGSSVTTLRFESQAVAVSTTGGRENVAPVCVSAILALCAGAVPASVLLELLALDSVFPQKLGQIAAVLAG